MELLNKKDVVILKYISKNEPKRATIKNKFNFQVDFRLDKLRDMDLIIFDSKINCYGEIIEEGSAKLTNRGKAYLENSKDQHKQETLNFLKTSIIVPIIVSIITNLAITVIQWLLR